VARTFGSALLWVSMGLSLDVAPWLTSGYWRQLVTGFPSDSLLIVPMISICSTIWVVHVLLLRHVIWPRKLPNWQTMCHVVGFVLLGTVISCVLVPGFGFLAGLVSGWLLVTLAEAISAALGTLKLNTFNIIGPNMLPALTPSLPGYAAAGAIVGLVIHGMEVLQAERLHQQHVPWRARTDVLGGMIAAPVAAETLWVLRRGAIVPGPGTIHTSSVLIGCGVILLGLTPHLILSFRDGRQSPQLCAPVESVLRRAIASLAALLLVGWLVRSAIQVGSSG
jgi:hypothetical protein